MAKKYIVKWTAPAREDVNEIIEYISETNINIENNLVYIMLVIDGRRNLEDILLKRMVLRENEI